MDFMEVWKRNSEIIRTENGAAARNTSRSAVYDMFALGGAYRNRSDEDITLLFHKAFAEIAISVILFDGKCFNIAKLFVIKTFRIIVGLRKDSPTDFVEIIPC